MLSRGHRLFALLTLRLIERFVVRIVSVASFTEALEESLMLVGVD